MFANNPFDPAKLADMMKAPDFTKLFEVDQNKLFEALPEFEAAL